MTTLLTTRSGSERLDSTYLRAVGTYKFRPLPAMSAHCFGLHQASQSEPRAQATTGHAPPSMHKSSQVARNTSTNGQEKKLKRECTRLSDMASEAAENRAARRTSWKEARICGCSLAGAACRTPQTNSMVTSRTRNHRYCMLGERCHMPTECCTRIGL